MKPGSSTRRLRLFWLGLLLLAMAAVAGCVCLPRHPIESAMVLADVAAADAPSRLKRTTPQPVRTTVQYEAKGKRYQADLYTPSKVTQAGLILVPGAAEEGKDDPRLVAFAQTLARVHFAVLVPDLEQVRRFDLGTNEIQDIARAIHYMSTRSELTPQGRLGIAAMSYAVGPTILAALQPDTRDRVSFILGIGGYYDLKQVVTFFTTGYFRDSTQPNSRWQHLEPNAYGKWVFVLSNVKRVFAPSDREILQEIAQRKIKDTAAPVDMLAQQLGPEGRAYYDFLVNTNPQRTPEMFARLPAGIRAEVEALNVASYELSQFKARLLLFHGRDDDIIPYTESKALAKAVGKDRARLYLIHGLAHVDLEGIGFRDRFRLWCGVDALLRERSPRGAKKD